MADVFDLLEAELLDERHWIAIQELCELVQLDLATIVELAEQGVVAPRGVRPAEWFLPAAAMPRLRLASRLMHDLGVNVSGAVLAVELLESRRALEQQLRLLEDLLGERRD
ncbi:MAG: MerR family transcriptional regulator [Gammaproteobacteria bacterium]|nr:MerR family transcriptional regulator [Gammaproteobacteria bacterium]